MNGNRKPLHEALAAAKLVEGSGGGSGTNNYNDLTNKPQINGNTLTGNRTSADLGLQSALTFDAVPTDGSTNPVESNGVYDALAEKMPASTKYGASITTTIDALTYVLTTTLKDQNGNTLGTAQTVDLPLETMVVGASFDSTTQSIILTLQSGQTVSFSVAALVAGLLEDKTSYTHFGNGLRLYVSSTEPMDSDIPDGSVWIGGTVST